MTRYTSFLLLFILFALGCGEEAVITPRPRAYPKIDFPEKQFQAFDKNYCNFSFQYPTYTQIIQDTAFFDESPAHPCWFDVLYPSFDARLHFTFATAESPEELDELRNDAFELVDWQNKRANYIEEIRIEKPDANVEGVAFDISGPAASPFQFYLTDGSKRFVRASLYFNTHINPDSLAPLYDFVKMDITQLIDTFEWQ